MVKKIAVKVVSSAYLSPINALSVTIPRSDVEKKSCSHCGKTLPVFGKDRKNGKETFGDWKSRTMHKKCWKETH